MIPMVHCNEQKKNKTTRTHTDTVDNNQKIQTTHTHWQIPSLDLATSSTSSANKPHHLHHLPTPLVLQQHCHLRHHSLAVNDTLSTLLLKDSTSHTMAKCSYTTNRQWPLFDSNLQDLQCHPTFHNSPMSPSCHCPQKIVIHLLSTRSSSHGRHPFMMSRLGIA